ncbi:4-alpha-glucanotransferase family protein [Mycobacterium xenopi 4042]|uniref:4-alpha-glucanotransferase n=1 Tax=Mycobacterium xenopi 4042 TaxID=1299334 RepID=X8BI44_MYCXE|nr:4-alpha-glucanotransferase family protein [Mycobacterium xenopi 4042]
MRRFARAKAPRSTTSPPGARWPSATGRLASVAAGAAASRRAGVADFVAKHPRAVDFHRWLQWQLDDQLAAAQSQALRAGMVLGIVHDLAVGAHPNGADAWALQDVLALGVTAGAPPDEFNQLGQDWSQPPWRPDRLVEHEYKPLRAMIRSVLRHAGGVRIDHIIGLFRLWWIPRGAPPTAGTYVRYDHEAMVGVVALEAHRAGALVVGEDLGTVERWVRDYLWARGVFGTSILWFELDRDGDRRPLPAERWREHCLSSVTTHDLPPTAGYLTGEHVRLRQSLGLLTRPVQEELEATREELAAWTAELRRVGLLGDDAGVEETVVALHQYLGRTPSRLLGLALTDAVGDRRTQNQPGTTDEYPNWRVPLAGRTAGRCCSRTCSSIVGPPRWPRQCGQLPALPVSFECHESRRGRPGRCRGDCGSGVDGGFRPAPRSLRFRIDRGRRTHRASGPLRQRLPLRQLRSRRFGRGLPGARSA